MTKFCNHPPINFDNAEQIASADNNPEWGHDYVRAMKGNKVHLFRSYNSGMDYGRGTTTTKTHLGIFDSPEALKDWLLQQKPGVEPDDSGSLTRSEIDDLLSDLGYKGEEA